METWLVTLLIFGGLAAGWLFRGQIPGLFRKPNVNPDVIARFIREGQALRDRSDERPLPVDPHNEWINRMNAYFGNCGCSGLDIRLNDISGLTQPGDGSDRSRLRNSIDGRLQRLHEFQEEFRLRSK